MINLSKQNECIVFEFTDNQHYLQNGKIECPVNSLTVVADESDMITVRKAASNDILISGHIDEFGMSKADLIDWFKVNAFAAGGGSSIVEVYVGTSADTIDPQTGVIDKKEGKKDWLNIAWKSDQGVYSLTKINLNEFIIEGEFASGVTSIEDGTVVGVVDKRANNKVYTAYDASGNPVSSGDVLTVGESGFTTNNIQTAINAKAEVIKKIIEDNELVIAASLNDLETRKAEWVSAVTDGNVTKVDNVNKLTFYNRSGNTLFEIELPASKPISGVNGVDVASGETLDVISGVVDDDSDIVVTKWNDDGTSAATDDVLSVSEDGFKVEHIQEAIDAKHANTIKLNGFTSGLTEDLFEIMSGDTVTQAFMKIEDKLYKDSKTGIIFDESSDDITILSAGTY